MGPKDIECPQCHAKAGQSCKAYGYPVVWYHPERVTKAAKANHEHPVV